MINNYLYIEGNTWNYQDNVFSGIATVAPKQVSEFCFNKAQEMRHSTLGNYSVLSKSKREKLAKLWEASKDLPEGKYDYYFNLGDKREVFVQSVKELATRLGIKYDLILKEDKIMARFRAKYFRADIDGCDYIIQKKCLFFWRCYDPMLYIKDEALKRLKEIEENYPNVRPANVLKEIKI